MLNIITITSIKLTISQAEINPYNDYQNPPLNNYITDSPINNHESKNIQSLTNIIDFKNTLIYYLIKTHEAMYFQPFHGVGKWEQLNQKIHFANLREYDKREYLYCTKSNRIYNKPIVRTSSLLYQSPTINMVVDNEVKIKILVNDPQTKKFDTECIAQSEFILFYNLIGNEQEVHVYSLIFFFKYHGVIYCSIQQVEPGLTIEMVEDLIQQRWQDFIKDFVAKIAYSPPLFFLKNKNCPCILA